MVSIFHSAAPEQPVWIKNPLALAIGTAIALAAQAGNPPANTWCGSLSSWQFRPGVILEQVGSRKRSSPWSAQNRRAKSTFIAVFESVDRPDPDKRREWHGFPPARVRDAALGYQ
jgi:hypothetical protein